MKKGETMSIEQRNKISASLMGHPVSEKTRLQCGSIWKGKHPPTEFKKGMTPKTKGQILYERIGENHPLWNGGSPNTYRQRAKKLFRYINKDIKCDKCGNVNDICIHHIDMNYKNNKLSNLQPLCRSCHISLHKKGIKHAKRNNSN